MNNEPNAEPIFEQTIGKLPIEASVSISDKPNCCICFHDAGSREIGRLDWNDGTVRFLGNADESAKFFAAALDLCLSEKMRDYAAALMRLSDQPEARDVLAKWRLSHE